MEMLIVRMSLMPVTKYAKSIFTMPASKHVFLDHLGIDFIKNNLFLI